MDKRKLEAAAGNVKSDLVLKNGNVLNMFTNEIIKCDVAICGDQITGLGIYSGEKEIDCSGKYIAPGLIDAHMHMESSMLLPGELSKVLVKSGTTTIIADPHEAVNVKGKEALDYILKSTDNILTNAYIMIPSSVPATDMDTNGCGEFLASDMKEYISHPRVLGLGETMRFVELLQGEKRMAEKADLFQNTFIDGHAPGLSGKELQAYRFAGVDTDHECAVVEEGLEKLRAGFWILLREGSGAKNVETLLKGFLEAGVSLERCAFCTDDKHTAEIKQEGHISTCVRKAIQLGVPPLEAYKMGSYQAARLYGLKKLGAVGAGFMADILILDSLEEVKPSTIIKGGRVLEEKDYAKDYMVLPSEKAYHTVFIPSITKESLQLEAKEKNHIIKMNPYQLLTSDILAEIPQADGLFMPDETYNKICVIERHNRTNGIGVAPLAGFGIRNGAVATSVSHDSHNVIAAGDNDEDIIAAVNCIAQMNGGYAIASNGKIIGKLPLPVFGLMSDQPCNVVEETLSDMLVKARAMGICKDTDPFITLSFMALTVIPEIRITEKGIVFVN